MYSPYCPLDNLTYIYIFFLDVSLVCGIQIRSGTPVRAPSTLKLTAEFFLPEAVEQILEY